MHPGLLEMKIVRQLRVPVPRSHGYKLSGELALHFYWELVKCELGAKQAY